MSTFFDIRKDLMLAVFMLKTISDTIATLSERKAHDLRIVNFPKDFLFPLELFS
jgi:hypothetical protein